MGSDYKQRIVIEQIVDVKNTLKGIDDIKQALGKLAISPETKASFDRLFSRIEQQSEKANEALASGFKKKGDVDKYSNAINGISTAYEDLIRKIEVLKSKNNTVLFGNTDALKQAQAEITNYGKAIVAAKKDLENFRGTAAKGIMAATSNHSTNQKWWDQIRANFTETKVDVDKVSEAITKLQAIYKNADTRGWTKGGNAEQWALFKQEITAVETALNEYNIKLKTADDAQDSFDNAQKTTNDLLNQGHQLLEQAGQAASDGAQDFSKFAKETKDAANSSQRLSSELEQFKNKAAYFFGLSNAINLFKRSIRSAYDTVKDLDAVMTETAVVTNFDVGDMWSQLPEYTQRANELGVSIHSAYEAATIFYQQGLKTNEVMAVSNETLKMARIAGLDAATASDRMTNALRGFNMEMDKMSAQRVNDVYSKLAAITASNTDEISTAMTKVASLAHNANMEFETTAAFLAQIIESTRESAETAGTALKTVVARFSEVKKLYSKGELLGQDEEGEEIDVNKVSTALRSAGINLNEYLTGAKGLDDIFMELAEKWDDLDIVQQRYIATMAAGSRQQSRFIALMSDYKRTVQLVDAANNANGASQEQYSKTLESLETKLARLKNAWDEFILGLTNSDVIKGAVDLLTLLITKINDLIKLVSGRNAGVKMITTFFAAFTGFKVGQKIFGGTEIGKLFSGLTQIAGTQGEKGGLAFAKNFYTNLSNKIIAFGQNGGIGNALEKGIGNQIKGFSGDLLKYFNPTKSALINTSSNQQFFDSFFNNSEWNFNVPQGALDRFYNTVGNGLDEGTLTVDQLNTALRECGQTIQVTNKNAADFGITLEDENGLITANTGALRRLSAAAVVAGGAMMALGGWMEGMEGPAKNWGTVIKGLGAGLVTFGTIMSVWLPLQAKLMAQGVSSAIYATPIIGWIAAIVSAVIALGVAISGLIKNNSLETKLEKSQEATKAATDAAEEAKEAYEKLGEAWDNLDEKSDAIENATKGTQEWRDAVKELNEAVLELMNTYEGVQVKRNAEGILEITNKEEIEEREKNRAITASAVTNVSRINSLNLDQEMRNKGNQSGVMDYQQYKSLIDYLISEGKLDEVAEMTEDESLEVIERYFKANGWDYGETWQMRDQAAKDLIAYAQGTTNTDSSLSAERTAIGSEVMNMANIDRSLQKYANAFLSDDYIDKLVKKNNESVQELAGINLKNAYAVARGYSDYTEYKQYNSEEEEPEELEMRNYILTKKVLDEATTQTQKFVNNIHNLTEAEKALFDEQKGGGLTKEQALQFKEDSNNESKMQELFEKYGGVEVFGSIENFTQRFNDSWENALDSFDTSRFSGVFVSELQDGLVNNLSADTFKSFTNNLWSVYMTSGKEGVQQIQDSIKAAMGDIDDPKEIEAFVKALNSADWTSIESIQTLDSLAEEYGISEEAMKGLENQIVSLNNAARQVDLEKMTSGLLVAKKIASGEQGRSFSKEDYEAIIASGADKKDFVYNIETDAYDYIGQDIQDVATAIREGTTAIVSQLDKDYASASAAAAVVSEMGRPDRENAEELRNFLGSYIIKAGEDSIIDWDYFYTANLEGLQAVYDKLDQQISSYGDIQANLEESKLRSYQADTGVENAERAIEGDEIAKRVLQGQVSSSDMSEEAKQQLLSGVEQDDMLAIKSAGAITDVFAEASQYGIASEDLNEYIASLQQVDTLENANIATLYELALANAKYQDGFKNVIDSYDEWIELKKEDGSIRPDEGNEVQTKAYTQLKKDLKEMFNLTEDVSDEFLRSADNVELLEKAINGDMDAVSELRGELAKTNIADSVVNKDKISEAIDAVIADMPNFEFGMSLDDSEAMKELDALLQASGMTAEQIQAIYDSLGWAPELKYEEMDVASASQLSTTGWQEIIDPVTQQPKKVRTDSLVDYATDGKVQVPVIGNSQKFVKPSMPTSTPSAKSSGGGGGGGSEKKPSYWENPYDELYNLQEKINESLRTREALERRYQKLLKQEQATLKDIRKSYYAQINQLSAEAELQKQFAAGRLRQIDKLGSELYTDSEGDRSSFSSWGVTKYASYDKDTGLIQIDWEGLEEISNDSSREEEGKAAEAYISKLEELVSSYEDVRDKLWDIEDTIEQLREEAIDSYLSFEDRVMEALVNRYQKEIDSYQAMSDAIDKANNEVLDSLREQIDLSRQIRDNTQKEEDIADMENRLAYLQRDTSGANALEIQKLQKDIEQARESYTDTLVDQAIEKMQNDADLAAEQRAKQIEIMQAQLDKAQETGELWHEVWGFINKAAEGDGALSPHSELIKLLEESEAFKSLSTIGQQKWWENAAEEFHKAWIGKDEAEDKYDTDANGDGEINNSGTSAAIENVSEPSTNPWNSSSTSSPSVPEHDEKEEAGVAMNICGPNNGWGNNPDRTERLEEKGFDAGRVQSIVNDIIRRGWDDSYYREKYGIYDLSDYSYYAFKSGGLADFTGPAWLDGTKTKPELVLNAQDTQNFIALKDILASLLNVQGFANNAQKGGDNYFDIDINAQLEGDYDVDKLTEKIKHDIYNDGQYRNVNTLNYLR